ncbi:MAG: D-amino acid dehydrogenase [Paucibacter sp.]|nr:D-amino acid dehydrogenase [Roseateles sp.]
MKHIVVIGGGIVGLTTAWALLERGHKVTVVEREAEVGMGASHANGGQLSYRYVSPLADAGVPIKALRWLLDPDGPLRFKPEASWSQWSWMLSFLRACSGPVNRRTTARLLALGAHSQTAFARLHREARLGEIALRAPGKLVVYRKPAEFERVARRLKAGPKGPERALSHDECVAVEPSLKDNDVLFAGGIFTEGEAVADCYEVCRQLAARLREHASFQGIHRASVQGLRRAGRRVVALKTSEGELDADGFVIAAGLQSRDLARDLGLSLPLYPLKGYSLTAPIEAQHRPPEVSVTDFERKILYARIGSQLRVAAMVDLVGEDLRLDPKRVDSLKRAVRDTFPQAADYDHASIWTGLRPATPTGAPMLGATPFEGLWLNVGHGALGFTFSFGAADIVAELISGHASPLPLDGLQFAG